MNITVSELKKILDKFEDNTQIAFMKNSNDMGIDISTWEQLECVKLKTEINVIDNRINETFIIILKG